MSTIGRAGDGLTEGGYAGDNASARRLQIESGMGYTTADPRSWPGGTHMCRRCERCSTIILGPVAIIEICTQTHRGAETLEVSQADDPEVRGETTFAIG
jgi:hypothetical protein